MVRLETRAIPTRGARNILAYDREAIFPAMFCVLVLFNRWIHGTLARGLGYSYSATAAFDSGARRLQFEYADWLETCPRDFKLHHHNHLRIPRSGTFDLVWLVQISVLEVCPLPVPPSPPISKRWPFFRLLDRWQQRASRTRPSSPPPRQLLGASSLFLRPFTVYARNLPPFGQKTPSLH